MKLFQEEDLRKISSPEQLNDYMKVTNISVWLLLGVLIFILLGICIWGIVGRMETIVDGNATSNGQNIVVEIAKKTGEQIRVGMEIRCGEQRDIVRHTFETEDYYMVSGTIKSNSQKLQRCSIVLESIPPVSFLIE